MTEESNEHRHQLWVELAARAALEFPHGFGGG